MNMDIIRKLNT